MKKRKKLLIPTVGLLTSITILTGHVFAETTPIQTQIQTNTSVVTSQNQYLENLAYSIGIQAYLYGFPLVDMARTKQLYKNPWNTFLHRRDLVDHTFKEVVAPNNDTLYSSAWLDLSNGPVVLSVPDVGDRYYSLQFLDTYTNTFDYVGTRETGTKAGTYVIVGPNWKGKIDKCSKVIQSPTNMVWLLGRTLVDGEKDLDNVHAIQDQYILKPLNRGQTKSSIHLPPISTNDFDDPARFFDIMTQLMSLFPSPATDAAMLSQFKLIGIDPNNGFQGSKEPAIMAGLTRAVKDAQDIIKKSVNRVGTLNHNWQVFYNIGTYGTEYLTRAVIAKFGLGANIPAEAMYPRTQVDSDGNPLSGEHQYVIHFNKEELPPVNAFWSLSMYGSDQFFVDNPIKRYAIGDRTEDLIYNVDGSLDIYIQNLPPEGKESNWLPAPSDDFILMLRMYMPKKNILKGTYQMPKIQKVK
ncbi:DUF1254 domain-containing protein [Bacillus cereus]|uniref:DUF1254 domain-containing protein n=1 Tax=Bacillus cereus TaxID=1396 RepID=UPI000BEC2447|nr:DUF1254 domain-containing protein [Bacillus cereus]PEE33117.1 hypothetical protein CON59_27265 [Bacillus cereus]PET44563.1 hypothetical protein CN523_18750 [Bacillus cereus]PFA51548.1 hypothetical protein CN389_22115 [Bacillus cereus]PFD66535.1 hypothetical protein CN271_22315 [Bacillus cereus]PFE76005.1 hypothetical protein CN319_15760 [Bacillus cereus]